MPKKRVFRGAGGAAGAGASGKGATTRGERPHHRSAAGNGDASGEVYDGVNIGACAAGCCVDGTAARRGSLGGGGFLFGEFPFPLCDGAVGADEQRRVSDLRGHVLIGDPQARYCPEGSS